MRRFTSLEARIDVAAHRILARLPQTGMSGAAIEFLVFGLKQAWACLFGGAMLGLILLTRLYWPETLPLARYDFLFIAALLIQIGMLWTRLESFEEAKVIFIFHLVGTIMEMFKTGSGSWLYPEASVLHIASVPLFSGFMYSCIGSFMTRILRIFDIRFSRYPPFWMTAVLGGAIYVNFFSHHFIWDVRYALFAATAALFLRTSMHFRVFRYWHSMPILLAFLLTSIFIWFAENIGTWSRAWIYPGQADGWSMVSFEKLGSWYLLMIISVVLVTVVHPPRAPDVAIDSEAAGANVADAIPPQNI